MQTYRRPGPKTALDMIAEWRRGCSFAPVGRPEECHECTRALVDAIERKLRQDEEERSDFDREWANRP